MSTNPESANSRTRPWWRRVPLWPRSLAGQLIAALLLALLVAQIITIFIFAFERSNIALDTMRGQVLERTASVVRVLNSTDESLHRRVIRAAEGPGILYRFQDKTRLALPRPGSPEAMLTSRLERRAGLEQGTVRISRVNPRYFSKMRRERDEKWRDPEDRDDRRFRDRDRDHDRDRDYRSDDRGPRWQPDRDERKGPKDQRRKWGDKRPQLAKLDLAIAVPLDNGRWLSVRTGVPTTHSKWGVPFLISMMVTAILMVLVVVLVVRKLTAPLRKLEGAARKLGRGEAIEPLVEEGPKEVCNTIVAFNGMQDRLMRFVQDRTRMLAAISHDLRTPITTLRLRAEFIDDDEMRDKVLETLEEMQAMTEAVLAFAREDASNEETKEVDLSALLSSMSEDYVELGKDVGFSGPDSLVYHCRPVSLKRACRNLIENALRYAGNAEITLDRKADGLTITIADNGPGIPEDKIEEAFAPFFRVEGSRNLETGGVGLGLSITRTIIRSHGGDVTLANRTSGGLAATITLPL